MFGIILGVLGAVIQGVGAVTSAAGNAKAAEASKKAEKLREKQMNLESRRQKMQTYRNVLKARSEALTNATAQGAGSGSGIAGGLGQVTGEGAANILGISQGQQIGKGIFAANRQVTDGQTLASFGGGLSSFGQTIGGLNFGDTP